MGHRSDPHGMTLPIAWISVRFSHTAPSRKVYATASTESISTRWLRQGPAFVAVASTKVIPAHWICRQGARQLYDVRPSKAIVPALTGSYSWALF